MGCKESYKYPKWSYPNYNPTYNRLTESPGPASKRLNKEPEALVGPFKEPFKGPAEPEALNQFGV